MKPWERYQQAGSQQPGPWVKYQAQMPAQPDPQVQHEMSAAPEQSFWDKPIGNPMDLVQGGVEGIKRFGEGINQSGSTLEEKFPVLEDISQGLEDLTGGFIRNVPPVDEYNQQVEERRAEYEHSPGANTKLGNTGVFVGENAPALAVPAARMTAPLKTRLMANAGAGTVVGATQYVDEGETRGENMTYGAIFSALGGEVARGLITQAAKAVRAMKGVFVKPEDKIRAAYDALEGVPEEYRMQVARDVAEGLTPPQAMKKAEYEIGLGVKPTKGKLTNDPKDLAMEDRLVNKMDDAEGLGDELRNLSNDNNRAMLNKMDDLVGEQGGNIDEAYAVGERVAGAIDEGKKAAHVKTSQAYEAIAKEYGKQAVSIKHFADEMLDKIDFAPQFRGIESINNRLQRFGVIDDEGQVVRPVTMEQAENLRKLIGKLVGTEKDKFGKAQLIKLKDAIQKDMESSVGDDVFAAARKVAMDEFGQYDNAKVVRAIMDGKLTPDNMIERIVSKTWTAAHMKQLTGTLGRANPQALKDLKSGIVRHITEQATAGKALNSAEDYVVSGIKLKKVVDGIGRKKLKSLLGPDEAQKLVNFANAAHRFTYKIPGTTNPSGTAGRLEQMIETAMKAARAVRGIPGIGNIADGWITARNNKQLAQAAREAMNPVPVIKKANEKASKQAAINAARNSKAQETARVFRDHEEGQQEETAKSRPVLKLKKDKPVEQEKPAYDPNARPLNKIRVTQQFEDENGDVVEISSRADEVLDDIEKRLEHLKSLKAKMRK